MHGTCVNASNMNMFIDRIHKYLRRAINTLNCWNIDKHMASLSTGHLGLCLV